MQKYNEFISTAQIENYTLVYFTIICAVENLKITKIPNVKYKQNCYYSGI